MRRAVPGLVILSCALAGCPPPAIYTVRRPGLDCDRATRVAHRTLVALGYTVTEVVPAGPDRPGVVRGTKAGPEGQMEAGARIACDAEGATVQPIEGEMVPTNWEFSRAFGLSFKSLVQRPDVETPRAEAGLEVAVRVLTRAEAVLDLGGSATAGDAVLVRVTVRNHTDREVALDPARLDLVTADGDMVGPLAGAALGRALAPGAAGERVRAEALAAQQIGANTTATGYLVYPAGAYRDAMVDIEDVETGESEGFVLPVE